MAGSKTTEVLTIQHIDSKVEKDLTLEEYEELQPRVRAMYKILKRQAVTTPKEVAVAKVD